MTVAVTRLVAFIIINESFGLQLGVDGTNLNISLKIPFMFLQEMEPFVGAIVSCFPGIRAWVRARRARRYLLAGGSSHCTPVGDFLCRSEDSEKVRTSKVREVDFYG